VEDIDIRQEIEPRRGGKPVAVSATISPQAPEVSRFRKLGPACGT